MTRPFLSDIPRFPLPDDPVGNGPEELAEIRKQERRDRIHALLIPRLAEIMDMEGCTKLGGPSFDEVIEDIAHVVDPTNTNCLSDAEKHLKEAKVF